MHKHHPMLLQLKEKIPDLRINNPGKDGGVYWADAHMSDLSSGTGRLRIEGFGEDNTGYLSIRAPDREHGRIALGRFMGIIPDREKPMIVHKGPYGLKYEFWSPWLHRMLSRTKEEEIKASGGKIIEKNY